MYYISHLIEDDPHAMALLTPPPGPHGAEVEALLRRLVQQAIDVPYAYPHHVVPAAYTELMAATPVFRGQAARALAQWLARLSDPPEGLHYLARMLLEHCLFQSTVRLDEPAADLQLLQQFDTIREIAAASKKKYVHFHSHERDSLLEVLAKQTRPPGLPADLRAYLEPWLTEVRQFNRTYDIGRMQGVGNLLVGLLNRAGAGLPPLVLFPDDQFGRLLRQFIDGLDPAAPATRSWLHLLGLWQKATASQPSAKQQKELAAAVAALGADAVREWGRALLTALAAMRLALTQVYQGHNEQLVYLLDENVVAAKGLIWTLTSLADAAMLTTIGNLAVTCHAKVPNHGPLSVALGNACLLALAQRGLPGVTQLSRLRPRIKQTSVLAAIARHIDKAAAAAGVSAAEIEDMAVPDFGLQAGQAVTELGEYTATLTLAAGQAALAWSKDGKPLKAAPATLKASHAAELKELKSQLTQLQQTYLAQRERLDRSFITGRRIAWSWFRPHYFEHGLLAELVRPLIWRLYQPDGTFSDALWLDNAWRDAQGQSVAAPDEATQLELWHPVMGEAGEVLAWRALLDTHQLRQPLKQAYREVYLLTPPEERTRTYSNRMAAHLLRQHQFSTLAKGRGWQYSLRGAFDNVEDSDRASLPLPTAHLTAEFWVKDVSAPDGLNETGIFLYMTTDQVRFVRDQQVVPLPEVPPQVFSEVLRDVDLFVGVASVGNDPQWRDSGGSVADRYTNYWHEYGFGKLSEVAKNRRLILERLVPRLKIARVSELRKRFLVVQGKRRTYKIHLGSGNILMEPNDQYLCIVPSAAARPAGADGVFLPFEGDQTLSIILSKALLLMDDDKITDETILRQLG